MCIIDRIISLIPSTGKREADLARHLGVGTSQITNWKTRHTDPPARYIMSICDFLEVDPFYLLTGDDKEEFLLTDREKTMIGQFRHLHPYDQEDVYEIVNMKFNRIKKKESSFQGNDGGSVTA